MRDSHKPDSGWKKLMYKARNKRAEHKREKAARIASQAGQSRGIPILADTPSDSESGCESEVDLSSAESIELELEKSDGEEDDEEMDMDKLNDAQNESVIRFMKNNLRLPICALIRSELTDCSDPVPIVEGSCISWSSEELKNALLLSLVQVIAHLEDARPTFGEILHQFSANIKNTIKYTIKWAWCLDYVIPLICLTYCSAPNYVDAYDHGCALVCHISESKDKDPRVDIRLRSEVLSKLLEANFQISIQSQIAFETVLFLLSNVTMSLSVLKLISNTRGRPGYESPQMIPYRCMRSEYLRIVMLNSKSCPERLSTVTKACIQEIKASIDQEKCRAVKTRYRSLLKEEMEVSERNGQKLAEPGSTDGISTPIHTVTQKVVSNLRKNRTARVSCK
uniref:ARAD1D15598p n=1 Tax=Blastobotrys adeninivorans TaxID=409370 RepID=A0A060T9Z8_BLAAD